MAFGGLLFLVGLAVFLVGRLGPLGRIPGDFVVQRGNFVLYLPLGLSLLLSLVLSLVGYLLLRR